MAGEKRMLRLLQGDVGSGKTIVALLALLDAVEAGLQGGADGAHRASGAPASGLAGALCRGGRRAAGRPDRTGKRGPQRAETLARLAAGEIDILIGTHALFSEDVAFRDLGLAVVDEQHRFGVHQRMKLQGKGRPADVLVMTATPIPRTLALTAYGDMDVSRITGRPPGRKPVETRVMSAARLDELIAHLRPRWSAASAPIGCARWWRNPKRSISPPPKNAPRCCARALGGKVGLVHGQMKAAERDAAMAAFKAGETQLLVATTVIEVGVDVPEATIMVVEHAERFGLAQLHQLRGPGGPGHRQIVLPAGLSRHLGRNRQGAAEDHARHR